MGFLRIEGPFLAVEGDDNYLIFLRSAVRLIQEHDVIVELWAEVAPGSWAGAKMALLGTDVTAAAIARFISGGHTEDCIECPISVEWPVPVPSL